ncbi:MAG: type II toxin-antitoxin system HicA family toxin [Kiritimatiellae bacterium]|nr:type II toxin-antitoxin system HicA family toxin [Kiritimatiellia bacterium]
MKRVILLKHLREQGCVFIREGGSHSWWQNPAQNRRSSVPRHTEINDLLARKICKDLGIRSV